MRLSINGGVLIYAEGADVNASTTADGFGFAFDRTALTHTWAAS